MWERNYHHLSHTALSIPRTMSTEFFLHHQKEGWGGGRWGVGGIHHPVVHHFVLNNVRYALQSHMKNIKVWCAFTDVKYIRRLDAHTCNLPHDCIASRYNYITLHTLPMTLHTQKSCCSVCVFIISTYTDGTPPEPASWFCQWLSDTACDFRVSKTFLSGLHYAVFGLGDSLYGENYNTVGKGVFEWLEQLSAAAVFPLGLGDQNVAESKHGGKCPLRPSLLTCCVVCHHN